MFCNTVRRPKNDHICDKISMFVVCELKFSSGCCECGSISLYIRMILGLKGFVTLSLLTYLHTYIGATLESWRRYKCKRDLIELEIKRDIKGLF